MLLHILYMWVSGVPKAPNSKLRQPSPRFFWAVMITVFVLRVLKGYLQESFKSLRSVY